MIDPVACVEQHEIGRLTVGYANEAGLRHQRNALRLVKACQRSGAAAPIPLLAGREFTRFDNSGSPRVAVVNEAFARHFHRGPEIVGRKIRFGEDQEIEVVGLARNAKHGNLRKENVVTQRTREFGLRMALGASRAQVRVMVFRQVGGVILIGGAIGLILAIGLGRLAQSLLYQLKGYDPLVIVGATACLASVALLAALVPAYRASRIDPAQALRFE